MSRISCITLMHNKIQKLCFTLLQWLFYSNECCIRKMRTSTIIEERELIVENSYLIMHYVFNKFVFNIMHLITICKYNNAIRI